MTNDPIEHMDAAFLAELREQADRRRLAHIAKRARARAAQPIDEWDYLWGLPWPYEPADYGELQ